MITITSTVEILDHTYSLHALTNFFSSGIRPNCPTSQSAPGGGGAGGHYRGHSGHRGRVRGRGRGRGGDGDEKGQALVNLVKCKRNKTTRRNVSVRFSILSHTLL